ncbi:DedA family protein [Patescibacteria group bacterium]|nr:DedA family protein [Patescibacteria group bacterium]MBU1730620.1 DedA family protein [Patescibacteria group bacterium]MBU1956303.1 DedA family protein [Patescibacteria group bacterium]
MKFWLTKKRDQIRDWTVRHAEGAHAQFWLIVFSFAEASFFPIPPDILLIAILLTNSAQWIWYCLVTTLSSVAGGIFGYVIGYFFFVFVGKPLIAFYNLEVAVAQVGILFSDNAFWTIFFAAFTPIPFKVFTIVAGLFHINFGIFLTASLLGRGMRFFAIGYLLRRFGKKISVLLYKYFNIFSLLFALLIITAVVCSTWR